MNPTGVRSLMGTVGLATLPVLAVRLAQEGFAAALPLLGALAGALAVEALYYRSVTTLRDGSALLTGWLLGLALPGGTPPVWALTAGALALGLGKLPFGGLGRNPFNPAMVGYAAALLLFPLALLDGQTGATPLASLAARSGLTVSEWRAAHPGPWGAGSGFALSLASLAGGLWLLYRRRISWHAPLGYGVGLASAALLAYDGGSSQSAGPPLFHLFAGSSLFAAFFIITDPVSGAHTPPGRLAMGLLAGALTLSFRTTGPFPDGVAFAVLLANAAGPAFDALAEARRRQTPRV